MKLKVHGGGCSNKKYLSHNYIPYKAASAAYRRSFHQKVVSSKGNKYFCEGVKLYLTFFYSY